MNVARAALRVGADAARASGIAAAAYAVALASAGATRRNGLDRFALFAAAEHWIALMPIALTVIVATTAAVAPFRRRVGLRRAMAAALGGAALAALAALHHPVIEALQGAVPALGDALARARAFVTTQPRPVVLACAVIAALAAAWRSARPRQGRELADGGALALLALGAVSLHVGRTQLAPPRANSVLLVVLDTVSARHLASAGYGRDTMPELEALAARGVRFPNAYSAAPWTVPSHASMFTGLAPIRHGATQEHVKLAQDLPTLADILRNQGFCTFAAVGNAIVGPFSQLDQGFAQFVPSWRRDIVAACGRGSAHPNNVAFRRFLATVRRDERFFAFVNYNDAHWPYAPPPPYDTLYGSLPRRGVDQSWQHYYTGVSALRSADFQELADLYDGELRKLSRDLGALVSTLASADRLHDTLVIVTSDHGEAFGDHLHLEHVFSLYDSVLHVPLFVLGGRAPAGTVDERLTTSVDVFATVLSAAGVDPSRWSDEGRDLLAPARPRGELVHEYYFPNQVLSAIEPALLERGRERLAPHLRRLRALRCEDGWKLIWSSDGRHELYHLAVDRDETQNLAAREPVRVAELARRFEQRLAEQAGRDFHLVSEPAPRAPTGLGRLDDETRERLRSLGYVQGE